MQRLSRSRTVHCEEIAMSHGFAVATLIKQQDVTKRTEDFTQSAGIQPMCSNEKPQHIRKGMSDTSSSASESAIMPAQTCGTAKQNGILRRLHNDYTCISCEQKRDSVDTLVLLSRLPVLLKDSPTAPLCINVMRKTSSLREQAILWFTSPSVS